MRSRHGWEAKPAIHVIQAQEDNVHLPRVGVLMALSAVHTSTAQARPPAYGGDNDGMLQAFETDGSG